MNEAHDRLKVLVIGSLPPPLGGTTVTLQYLVEELRRRPDVEVRVVDTSGIRGRGPRGAARLARAMARVAREARRVDVVTLHVATTAVPVWGLAVEATARALRRPFVLRKFADTDYLRLGPGRGRIAHVVAARADAYLAETKHHLETVRARGFEHARWFPTARPLRARAPGDAPSTQGGPCRRFVYVGHVTRLKGIAQLVEAAARLPEDVSVDVYGPLMPDVPRELLEREPRVRWHGELQANAVAETLSRYDAFVMPTVATTEGYPGSILEAYAAGLPVVVSRIGGIPEIVDEGSGILVEPGDVEQLAGAMRRLAEDRELFERLRRAAAERARDFSTEHWCDEFVECCRDLVRARPLLDAGEV